MPSSMLNSAGALELRGGHTPRLWAEGVDDPARWAARHRDGLRAAVEAHGALCVRGLGLRQVEGVAAVFHVLGDLMVEREGFAPRRRYGDRLYSASKWPPRQPMCLHHELSYAAACPTLMLFACLVAPEQGGATPLADAAAVLDALPPALVARFERVGWTLLRNYRDDIGATLAESFGVDDRLAVERYCQENAIEYGWQPDGSLRTRQRRAAVIRHPRSGRRCWFNQIAFLSAWSMEAELREYLADLNGPDGLPFDTCFGDGEPIDPETVQVINDAYTGASVRDDWQQGDLLLVDNLATAHGRERYTGSREVVAAMADALPTAPPAPPLHQGAH